MTILRDLTAEMDAAVDDTLGDAITYTPEGGAPLSFNAWVRYADIRIGSSGSQSTIEAIAVEVFKSVVATPSKDDRVAISTLPGRTFYPKAFGPDETGMRWVIDLAKVAI